jgi:biopolymer transport protein ExbD
MESRARTRIRRALRRASIEREEAAAGTGELSIVPLLDVITNLTVFLLATSSMLAMASEVSAETPATCARCPSALPSLDLTVVVTATTVRVAGSGGQLAPGCAATGDPRAPTILRDGHEWAALAGCAARVHAAYPDEREVRVSADPNVPYEDVIAAMDALRSDERGELFPDVLLAAGVR